MSQQSVAIGDTGLSLSEKINNNFTQLYNNSIVNAKDYGLSISNTGAQNRLALQKAVDGGNKTVYINNGVYDINDTILLDSNTKLMFELGATLHKVTGSGTPFTHVFLNRGSLTRTYDENITIDGLTVTGANVGTYSTAIVGLSGHMSFYYIKHLRITNYTCVDGGDSLFMFNLCKWEDVYFDGIKITSLKDAFALQTGRKAIISNAVLETRDDAIGLKTCDYPNHEAEAGDIDDILLYNITDSNYGGQPVTGYSVRVLLASWTDWANGNTYWRGDHCLSNGNLYISDLPLNGSAIGSDAPIHSTGVVTGADGIPWRFITISAKKNTTVSNVRIDGCNFKKGRTTVFAESWSGSAAGDFRGIYPGTEGTSFLNTLTITNCYFKFVNGVYSYVVRSNGGIKNLVISSSCFENVNGIYYVNSDANYIPYQSTLLFSFSGNHIDTLPYFINAPRNSEAVIVNGNSNVCNSSLLIFCAMSLGSTVRFPDMDIPLHGTMKPLLTPLVGDMVRDAAGRWVYKAAGWVNISI